VGSAGRDEQRTPPPCRVSLPDGCFDWQNAGNEADIEENEVIGQEMSRLAATIRALDERMGQVEKANARLEEAALITSRAMKEISDHWDAVYEAMRRKEAAQETA
jgi:predicted nuclease with TOPRIM domain